MINEGDFVFFKFKKLFTYQVINIYQLLLS